MAGVAWGERSGGVGADGEQTAAGARRRFAITRFRLGSTRVLHGEVARDARHIPPQTQRFELKIEPQTIKQMQGCMDAQQQNISAKFYKNNPSLFIFT